MWHRNVVCFRYIIVITLQKGDNRGNNDDDDNNNNNSNRQVVTRSLRRNLEAIPGKHSIDSLQTTAILGTSHIIRKVLQCEA